MHTIRTALGVLGLALTLPLLASPAQADEPRPKLVLIGDSIAVRNAGDPTSWMNVVAAQKDLELRSYAVSGTGIIKGGGDRCRDTYTSRLAAITKDKPSAVILEDVIGDSTMCRNNWFMPASRAQVKTATDTFMRDLALTATRAGVPRERVFVIVPATHKIRNQNWVRDLVATAAARHRFTFVPSYLTTNETSDGIHPNQKGHAKLAATLNPALAKHLP